MTGPILTTLPPHPILDLDAGIGQRSCTFRFDLVNGVTGENLGQIHPVRAASLTHDTTRTIKRQLTFPLGAEDMAAVNTVTDRVLVTMILSNGEEWPLGRYMFVDASRLIFTSGRLGAMALSDEMFLVDQEIEVGIDGVNVSVQPLVVAVLAGLPVTAVIEASPFVSAEAWGVGINRGSILESLSVSGDWFSPWFGNDTQMHFIRTFDPATRVPDFDFDSGFRVMRDQILETDDLLTAPNRFIVISNVATTDQPIVGVADVPINAPHSIPNRGFVIAATSTLQLNSQTQAISVARGLANRQTVFERATLTTPPDPRHDSYNVIKWQGELWLELAWSMALVEGGQMNHTMRKSYR